jgi:hypothetical protein
MPGPALSIVPFVWQALGLTTGMGILYDMEGPKVTLEAQERDANTREALRNAAIKQYEFDLAGNVEFDDNGLPTGNVSFGTSNIDITRYKKQNLTSPADGVPAVPETNGYYIYDPMDEWFEGEETKTEEQGSSLFEKIRYVTPPEIRRKVAETASFVTGGAYKLK